MPLFGWGRDRASEADEDTEEYLAGITDGARNRLARTAIAQAVKVPPRIAVIGQAGVGKSSTINALFGTNMPVSDIHAGTTAATAAQVALPAAPKEQRLRAPRGEITIIDMPGLGETLKADERYLPEYQRELPKVDVALWILDATRANAADQRYLAEVKSMLDPAVFDRIVLATNKVDTIQPVRWLPRSNAPDGKMERNIEEHLARLREIFGVDSKRLVGYSALKRYNLDGLLNAMLAAVPPDRILALDTRAQLAHASDLMDAKFRKLVGGAL